MAGAFGFSQPNQQPAPDPRLVGQQLAQPQGVPGQQVGQRPQVAQGDFALQAEPQEFEQGATSERDKRLRLEGGKLMGGGGSDQDPALSAAVGEALTSAGGGHQANPNPHKNRDVHVRNLQQLGLSETEAELLRPVL